MQSSFAMLCTLGCLDVTINGDDEAALDHRTTNGSCHAQTSLRLHHVRVLSALTRALRKIEPAYEPIRLTNLNSVGSKYRLDAESRELRVVVSRGARAVARRAQRVRATRDPEAHYYA